ncbi:hypothetical protein QBC38DRAFT_484290 [Podospora fimiseda]|uniref:Uncharacterized protein n=1 Tax=Podospora fimiseda TaxID=252190 RepID=A0AAN7BKD2_9PEZI|nr:hypothetical protein QBC38DRAFT_484290 [Podospora fimiseda]
MADYQDTGSVASSLDPNDSVSCVGTKKQSKNKNKTLWSPDFNTDQEESYLRPSTSTSFYARDNSSTARDPTYRRTYRDVDIGPSDLTSRYRTRTVTYTNNNTHKRSASRPRHEIFIGSTRSYRQDIPISSTVNRRQYLPVADSARERDNYRSSARNTKNTEPLFGRDYVFVTAPHYPSSGSRRGRDPGLQYDTGYRDDSGRSHRSSSRGRTSGDYDLSAPEYRDSVVYRSSSRYGGYNSRR